MSVFRNTFDSYDIAILSALSADPRMTTVELSRHVHLSRTAISRRIVSLRERGAFAEGAEVVAYTSLGFDIEATVEIGTPFNSSSQVGEGLLQMPEVLSVSSATGHRSLLLRVIAVDMPHLQRFIRSIERYGNISTSLLISTKKSTMRLVDRLSAIESQTHATSRCG